jgi:hypothetical protein
VELRNANVVVCVKSVQRDDCALFLNSRTHTLIHKKMLEKLARSAVIVPNYTLNARLCARSAVFSPDHFVRSGMGRRIDRYPSEAR